MKVPSDPGRLSSTQASFRVRLGASTAPLIGAPGSAFGGSYVPPPFIERPLGIPPVVVDAPRPAELGAIPAMAGVGAPRRKGRLTTVTWSGHAAPGDLTATQLLEAVRLTTVPAPAPAEDDTQLIRPYAASPGSRYGSSASEAPSHRAPGPYGPAVPRQSGGAATEEPVGPAVRPWTPSGEPPELPAGALGESRHAWYPGRRVDLGLVLLPLRVVLGSLSVYAGFSKLCNPVYFDGGDRGSMMRWLASLHPWGMARPLLDLAMAHPVGAGLGVAFIQVVAGVLTIIGLWQRLAAAATMVLSAALLFTVSWRTGPVYDTPDLIFLAAWSPLLIAGAPFASLDGRIALEAWRRYGASAPGALRRRVLRRGTVIATLVVGLALLTGSVLGAAVRTGAGTRLDPSRPSTDYGTPMWPGSGPTPTPTTSPSPSPSPTPSASPSASHSGKAHSSRPVGGNSQAPGTTSSSVGGATGGSTGGTTGRSGGSSGGTSPSSGSTGGGGLIGGVLGSGPLLGMGAGHRYSGSGGEA